jgi:hypothetical protein
MPSRSCKPNLRHSLNPHLALFTLAIACAVAGCISHGGTPTPPPASTTFVTLLLSSTANSQLSAFHLSVSGLTLTNKAGKSVTLFTDPNAGTLNPLLFYEAIHLNSIPEPVATASVPQDVYTSATFTCVYADFTFLFVGSSGPFDTNTNSGNCSNAAVVTTVSLPSPITISGTAMNLDLDLQVSKSATWSGTAVGSAYTLTPTFTLTAAPISATPTNGQNGRFTGLAGRVASVNTSSNSFTVVLPDRPTLAVNVNSNTEFQPLGSSSEVVVGAFVDMDLQSESDGTLLATRITVADSTALNVLSGQLLLYSPIASTPASQEIQLLATQQQGNQFSVQPVGPFFAYQFDNTALFQISGQFNSLVLGLPFMPTFSPSSMVLGQYISVSSLATSGVAVPLTSATTITLMPQTINASVTSVSTSGVFQVYTVFLASYDTIPLLSGISSVFVYTNSSTQLLNSTTVAVGVPFRFNGFLFNDNGTLRMVCAQVSDGVNL